MSLSCQRKTNILHWKWWSISCLFVCLYAPVSVNQSLWLNYLSPYTRSGLCMSVNSIHTHIQKHSYAQIHRRAHRETHEHIHGRTHIHTHKYTHTYTYASTLLHRRARAHTHICIFINTFPILSSTSITWRYRDIFCIISPTQAAKTFPLPARCHRNKIYIRHVHLIGQSAGSGSE